MWLSYRAFARRRLRRPSDKPRCCRTAWRSAPRRSRAYANLTVGWNNAALAARRDLAPSASARRDAADALFARSDLDPSAVMGANPEIAGDGTAESVAPLLTGYEGFLPFAPFEDKNAFGRTGREGERGSARDPLANDGGGFPRSINAWLADDLAAVESVDGSHYPETSGSWRAVAARVGGSTPRGPTRRRIGKRRIGNREKTQRTRAALGTEGSTNRSTTARSTNANVLTGSSLRAPWTARTFPWASVPDARAPETAGGHARVLLAARARRRGRRRGGTTRRRARVRKRLRYRPGDGRLESSRDFGERGRARQKKRVRVPARREVRDARRSHRKRRGDLGADVPALVLELEDLREMVRGDQDGGGGARRA